MSIFTQLISELLGILATFVMVLPYLIGYVLLIMLTLGIWRIVRRFMRRVCVRAMMGMMVRICFLMIR